jgi:hypothetical protein
MNQFPSSVKNPADQPNNYRTSKPPFVRLFTSGNVIHSLAASLASALVFAADRPSFAATDIPAPLAPLSGVTLDITSVGVTSRVVVTSKDGQPSNEPTLATVVTLPNNTPDFGLTQNAPTTGSMPLLSLLNHAAIAPEPASESTAPTTEPVKSDVDPNPRPLPPHAPSADAVPMPSSRLIGALLACALMFKRPRRHVRA